MLPEFFPSGLSGLYDKLKVPFLYYMPYWCMDNNTARTDQWQFITPQDCGWEYQFTFVLGNQSEAFHTELFTKYKPLGMSNYEQDFMVSERCFARVWASLQTFRPHYRVDRLRTL